MNCTNFQIDFDPIRLIDGICHRCTLLRANHATAMLRLLFYHRHAIGTKVEEAIAEEDPFLWRQCHRILNPRPPAPWP